jgi:uncharacterized damage-inducible protein DinB
MHDARQESDQETTFYFASFICRDGLKKTWRGEARSADEFIAELLRRDPTIQHFDELLRLDPPDAESELASANTELPVAQYNHELERRREESATGRGKQMWGPETPLLMLFEGWNGYQESVLHAVQSLTAEQVVWRPAPNRRSAGELAAHIAVGRIGWFQRMGAPGSDELLRRGIEEGGEEAIASNLDALTRWLTASWMMVENTLRRWTVADLGETYRQEYHGQAYAVSRQWTIWRILAHDIHHGGELALTLGLQGVSLPELGDLGGHVTMPPLAED